MAVVLAVLLAVICVVLAVMLVRSRAAATRTAAEVADRDELIHSLESEADRLNAEVTELSVGDAEQKRRIERLVLERESLIEVTGEQAKEAEAFNDQIEALKVDLERQKARSESLETDLVDLQRREAQRAAEPTDESRPPIAEPTGAGTAAESEAMLWDLELARSARTWRYSVATDPMAESPFLDAEDPLTLALEIEAAALREDVGARLTVEVDGTPADPGTALVVLRITQELLINAAHEAEQAVVNVLVRGRVAEISIDARDEDDGVVDVSPPVSGGRVRMIEGKLVVTADE